MYKVKILGGIFLDDLKVTFAPATTQRASDVIYQQIYEKIANGELKTGDRLPSERELADQFHRSRPSVREALRMLQQNKLIKIAVGVNGGAIVQGISLESAEQPLRELIHIGVISPKELAEYRTHNDRTCAYLAAQYHTQEDATLLREIIVRYGESIYDSENLAIIDLEFHKALAKASHNKLCILMTDVVSTLCARMFWDAVRKMSEENVIHINQLAYDNHSQIAEAVIAGDIEKLVSLMNTARDIFYDAVTSLKSTPHSAPSSWNQANL